MKHLILICSLFFFAGCQTEQQKIVEKISLEYSLKFHEGSMKAIDNCVKRGGIPIFSGWDNRLKDCK